MEDRNNLHLQNLKQRPHFRKIASDIELYALINITLEKLFN